jgi:hypothetical protein
MTILSIPSFSNPTNRADYTSVTNMLTNFFVSNGFKQSDAVAQAGLVLNLKQQGYSDADINTAIATQQNTLNSIAAAQAAQASAALAAEQPKVAATLALSAAAKVGEGANYGGNTLITVNGVTETRDQAANFAENSVGEMVANPNDPRGPLITREQYDQIIARNKLSTGSDTSLIATEPNVSKVVAINGVPVSQDPTKTLSPLIGAQPITDTSKALVQITTQANTDLNKTTTPVLPPAPDTTKTTTSTDPLAQFTTWLNNLISPVAKPASDALAATEKNLSDAISTTQKTIGDASSQAVNGIQKTFADTLASAEKSAADLAASASSSASAAQKQTTDFLANADLAITNLISKFTNAVSSTPDQTKTTQPPAPQQTTTTAPVPDTTKTTQPPPKPTLIEQAKAFFEKYSTPIVLGITGAGAIGSLAFVMSHNSKQGIIAR